MWIKGESLYKRAEELKKISGVEGRSDQAPQKGKVCRTGPHSKTWGYGWIE
jgi:hypothetical protein